MRIPRLLCAAIGLSSAAAGPTEDYQALTQGVPALQMGGTSGGIALQGARTFPIAISNGQDVVVAAGYSGDVDSGGRIVCFAHTSFVDGNSEDQKRFIKNVVQWVGRKDAPKLAIAGTSGRSWRDVGYGANSIDRISAETLANADVAIINLHGKPFKDGAAALKEFGTKGRGVIILTTPWAAAADQLSPANEFLADAGLALHGDGSDQANYPLAAQAPSPNWSALNAVDALLADKSGAAKLPAAEKQLCAASIESVLAATKPAPKVLKGLDELNRSYGWIRFTKSPALRKANNPIEAMLARYQSRQLETLPPDQLPAHPNADDFPGAVLDGPAVTKKIAFDATTGPDKLINHGGKTLINTGLYARPGQPITVLIPDAAIKAGLRVEIGIHTDRNWNLKAWRRPPQISRSEKLTQTSTKAGNAFGGLISLIVPENCTLGKTEATISGAAEAPVFTLGKTTEADWHARIKNAPGAWGYIETPKWTGYIPREILQKVEHPDEVAKYWQKVVDTADEYMGYAKWRRRGEAMLTDRDITVGYGHAGYPVMMAYAAENEGSRALVERGPQRGDWGFLHELGHTFQDSFDGNYTIATHAEVDVNLVPAIAIMLVHDRTAWDNNSHSTFDAKNRVKDMAAWDAKPEADRTWDKACKTGSVAYDFYFTMAECFGWDLYKKALGRLADWLHEPGKDPDLDALDRKDPNHKRNRFFLCFSQAAGRNLLPHFERYGLGKGEFGLSLAVIEKVKHLPAWSGNQPIAQLDGPARISAATSTRPGAELASFKATDPDAGTRFTFRIASGNESGAFTIEPRTGRLKLAKPAPAGTYPLTIEVNDSTVPLTLKSTQCEVTIR